MDDEHPFHGRDLRRPGLRPLRARPGGDSHVPGPRGRRAARSRRLCRADGTRAALQPTPRGRRLAADAPRARSRALLPARRRWARHHEARGRARRRSSGARRATAALVPGRRTSRTARAGGRSSCAAEGGAAVASSTAPAASSSDELRAYPEGCSEPARRSQRRRALHARRRAPTPRARAGRRRREPRPSSTSEGGFAALIDQERLSAGVIVVSLLVRMFWGAAHALTPGHGKAIVAAYMVGTRGTARHAFLLGGIVTVTHTIGVFALGLITLALSEFIVPESSIRG